MAECGHKSFQCGPAVITQGKQGPLIMVPQWCTECGDLELRLPQLHEGDKRRHNLLTATLGPDPETMTNPNPGPTPATHHRARGPRP